MRADDDVIVGDDRGENADRENDGQRGEAGGDKSEADDVRFARPPISIKQARGPLPIHIARPMDSCRNNFGHRY